MNIKPSWDTTIDMFSNNVEDFERDNLAKNTNSIFKKVIP
jgi:hypothetical protein